MGRPKQIRDAKRLNLYLPQEVKRALFQLATDTRRSLSGVVTELVLSATGKPAKSLDEK